QFVVKVFGNRFTVEEFLEGVHAWFLTSTIYSICLAIVGSIAEAVAIINAIDSKTNSAKKKRQRNRKNRSNQQK
ncbi:phage tail assembly chaperone G, partial [Bacillus mycoides]